MKKLTISLREDGRFKIDVEGRLGFEETVMMCLNTLRSVADSFIKAAPEEAQEDLKGQVYDSLNLAFARFLDDLIPPDDMQIDEAAIYLGQAQKLMAESVKTETPLKQVYEKEMKAILKKDGNGKMS